MGNEQSLDNHIFNLKFTSKQLGRDAAKAEKSAKAEKNKVAKAIAAGDKDSARIFAENAIRHHNNYLNMLRLSARLDAVAQKIQSSQKLKMVSKQMESVARVMDISMKQMDLGKMTTTMDQFEKQFEKLDITTKVMDDAMASSTSSTMPEQQVDELMAQIADENGLEVADSLGKVNVPAAKAKVESSDKEEQKLRERFEKLQQNQTGVSSVARTIVAGPVFKADAIQRCAASLLSLDIKLCTVDPVLRWSADRE